MTLKSVSAELIRRQAEELLELDYSEGRRAELATEVETINESVADVAALEFDDEPLAFAAFLRELARRRGRSP